MAEQAPITREGWVYLNSEGRFLSLTINHVGFGSPKVHSDWVSLNYATIFNSHSVMMGLNQRVGHGNGNHKSCLHNVSLEIMSVAEAKSVSIVTLCKHKPEPSEAPDGS